MPWDPQIVDSQILAIHAAVLPTNEVLLFGGDEHSSAQHAAGDIDNTRIYDVATRAVSPMSSPTTDVFCAGHSFLADGRLLVAGGTEAWVGDVEYHDHGLGFAGHREAWLYEPRARGWQAVASMGREPGHPERGGGRWYPTLVTLANGEVVAMFGHPGSTDQRHRNNNFERYSPGADWWAQLPSIAEAEAIPYTSNALNYPRVFLLRDGNLFFATPIDACRVYDPFAGSWVGGTLDTPSEGLYREWYGSAVLLPLLPDDGYAAHVLQVGAPNAEIMHVHAATPQWTQAGTRQGAAANRVRENVVAVLLPTGQVFLSGGDETVTPSETPVLEPEIYTPDIDWAAGTYGAGGGTWQSKEPAQIPRNYHSTALLLPNGHVWTAGSSINANQGPPATTGRLQIEIYKPDYDAQPNRPQISSAPASIGYGETFEVGTPQAESIARVALIRAGSVTHAFDADQRYVGVEFEAVGGSTLRCQAPPHGGVAPPGYYMLWLVDTNGRPCQMASFVRCSGQRCFVITDRSTFSSFEVEALLPPSAPAGPAAFPRSLYAIFDGFLPHELGSPIVAPTVEVRFDGPSGDPVADVTVVLRDVLYEDPTLPPDEAQRITFSYDVRFASAAPFATFAETRTMNVRFRHGSHVCDATLDLIKQPNPYMIDGPTHWLSTDVRVFQMRPGQVRAGVTHGSGGSAPHDFVQQLVQAFRAQPSDEFHPFFDISTDQSQSRLELARQVNGQRVYNYAVAKVRYRAVSTPAPNVRVFFRAFNTVGPALEFNPGTYAREGSGAATVPVLGTRGGELVSIPFFAAPRVDTGAVSMATQTDPLNAQTLQPAGAQEFTGYFGCWLDINQTEPRFPASPSGPGPYTNRLSIQELVRGRHQCLVAEVFFEPDPIHTGDTPGSSDNLSQRNLAIVESANPGEPATRTVHHTFDLRPSERFVPFDGRAVEAAPQLRTAAFEGRVGGPDELMIVWGDVPEGTQATIYWPGIDVEAVVRMAALRGSSPRLEVADGETLRVRVEGDVTFVPVPGGRAQPIAGLLSIELPEGVRKGELYTVSAHQWSGLTRRMLGAFQVTIRVDGAEGILVRDLHDLAVLRHIGQAIPAGDRWRPVFDRYLGGLADRVRAFGGDPDEAIPSPNGSDGGDGDGRGDGGGGRPGAGRLHERLCRLLPCLAALSAIVTATLGVFASTRRRSRKLRKALELSALVTAVLASKALLARCLGLCGKAGERTAAVPAREPFAWEAPPRVAAPRRERPSAVPPPRRASAVPHAERPPALARREHDDGEAPPRKKRPRRKPAAE
jgi:hypothetical protein